MPVHMESHVLRQHPEDASKASEQKRGLEKPDAKVGRELGQMAGVLVDALVGVAAHLPSIGQMKGALRFEPLVEKVEHQAFAKSDFGHLVEPGLRHVQDQKPTGNHTEDHKLPKEPAQFFVRESIIKGLVPSI